MTSAASNNAVMPGRLEPHTPSALGQSPAEIIEAVECLYALTDEISSDDRHVRVRELVKQGVIRFAHEQRFDEAFRLLAVIQIPPDQMDSELFHLRNALL